MSVSSLANSAVARRPDVGPPTAPRGLSEIAASASTLPELHTSATQQANGMNTTLNVLFGYIPTEILTLYVAVAGGIEASPAGGASADAASQQSQWIVFGCFFAATPAVVWTVYATKLVNAGKPIPAKYGTWPLWEMSAALIAFCAWAFALPDSPFRREAWYSPALASIAVLLASSILGLSAPLFQRPLGT